MSDEIERGGRPRPFPVVQAARRPNEPAEATLVLAALRHFGGTPSAPTRIRELLGSGWPVVDRGLAALVEAGDVIVSGTDARPLYALTDAAEARWTPGASAESLVIPEPLLGHGLRPRALLLAGYLYRQSERGRPHFASVPTIARRLGLPKRAVDRALASLRALGVLVEERHGQRGRSRGMDLRLSALRNHPERKCARESDTVNRADPERSGARDRNEVARVTGTKWRATATATATPTASGLAPKNREKSLTQSGPSIRPPRPVSPSAPGRAAPADAERPAWVRDQDPVSVVGESERSRRSSGHPEEPESLSGFTLRPYKVADARRIQAVIDRLKVKTVDAVHMARCSMTGWEAEQLEKRAELVVATYRHRAGAPSDPGAMWASWCHRGSWRKRLYHKGWRKLPPVLSAVKEVDDILDQWLEEHSIDRIEKRQAAERNRRLIEDRERKKREDLLRALSQNWSDVQRLYRRNPSETDARAIAAHVAEHGAETFIKAVGRPRFHDVIDRFPESVRSTMEIPPRVIEARAEFRVGLALLVGEPTVTRGSEAVA